MNSRKPDYDTDTIFIKIISEFLDLVLFMGMKYRKKEKFILKLETINEEEVVVSINNNIGTETPEQNGVCNKEDLFLLAQKKQKSVRFADIVDDESDVWVSETGSLKVDDESDIWVSETGSLKVDDESDVWVSETGSLKVDDESDIWVSETGSLKVDDESDIWVSETGSLKVDDESDVWVSETGSLKEIDLQVDSREHHNRVKKYPSVVSKKLLLFIFSCLFFWGILMAIGYFLSLLKPKKQNSDSIDTSSYIIMFSSLLMPILAISRLCMLSSCCNSNKEEDLENNYYLDSVDSNLCEQQGYNCNNDL